MNSFLKTVAIALAGILASGVVSCKNNEEVNGPITLLPYELTFESSAKDVNDEDDDENNIDNILEYKVVYVTSGGNWKATPSDSWIIVVPMRNENEIAVSVTKNKTGKDREGTITVSNADDSKVVNILQRKAIPVVYPPKFE